MQKIINARSGINIRVGRFQQYTGMYNTSTLLFLVLHVKLQKFVKSLVGRHGFNFYATSSRQAQAANEFQCHFQKWQNFENRTSRTEVMKNSSNCLESNLINVRSGIRAYGWEKIQKLKNVRRTFIPYPRVMEIMQILRNSF